MTAAEVSPPFLHNLEPLEGTAFSYEATSIDRDLGAFLFSSVVENQCRETLEIGCALGMASLYLCSAQEALGGETRHTILDPEQTSTWKSIGLKNLKRQGWEEFRYVEEPSELALPRLLGEGERFDLVFIDGWHSFDHALLDSFYALRLLRPGGLLILDDTDWPAVEAVARYLSRYPHLELVPAWPAPVVKVRHRLFRFALTVSRVVARLAPGEVRRRLFSGQVLGAGSFDTVPIGQRWVAFRKKGEDTRDYDWFKPF